LAKVARRVREKPKTKQEKIVSSIERLYSHSVAQLPASGEKTFLKKGEGKVASINECPSPLALSIRHKNVAPIKVVEPVCISPHPCMQKHEQQMSELQWMFDALQIHAKLQPLETPRNLKRTTACLT